MGDLNKRYVEAIQLLRQAAGKLYDLQSAVASAEDLAEFNDLERLRFKRECDEANLRNKVLEEQIQKLNQRLDSFGAQKSWTECLKEFIRNNGCPFCMSNMHAHDVECKIYKLEKSLGEQSYKAHLAELKAEEMAKDAAMVDELKKLVNYFKDRMGKL